MVSLVNLGGEKILDSSFSLQKTDATDIAEDVSSYLDTRMCVPKSNKLVSNDPASATYCIRKIKIGTWAKTSLREEAKFVLRATFKTNRGRVAEAVSSSFEIFSHQSQLPQKKEGKKPLLKRSRSNKSLLSKSLDSAVLFADDIFGLQSLSDAALKAASSEETAPAMGVVDAETKRMRLLEKADDLAVRIAALKEEERKLREEASDVGNVKVVEEVVVVGEGRENLVLQTVVHQV